MEKNTFRKRYFKTLKELFKEIRKIRHATGKLKKHDKNIISPQLQEKIMLAVCAVNSCVNCSYLHTKNALEKGVSGDEIKNLFDGELGDFPEDEAIALAYSQHWAEFGGKPDEKARGKVFEYYGKQKAETIEAYIQMVTIGNLVCNTVEAYKFDPRMTGARLSFFLTYLFCLPMAKGINISGKKGKDYLSSRGIVFRE